MYFSLTCSLYKNSPPSSSPLSHDKPNTSHERYGDIWWQTLQGQASWGAGNVNHIHRYWRGQRSTLPKEEGTGKWRIHFSLKMSFFTQLSYHKHLVHTSSLPLEGSLFFPNPFLSKLFTNTCSLFFRQCGTLSSPISVNMIYIARSPAGLTLQCPPPDVSISSSQTCWSSLTSYTLVISSKFWLLLSELWNLHHGCIYPSDWSNKWGCSCRRKCCGGQGITSWSGR